MTLQGLIFVAPYAEVATGYLEYVSTFLDATNATEVTEILYPPIFDGTYGYTTDLERSALTVGDALFVCTNTAITAAFNNQTYNYVFAVPPAIHASDLTFSFYTGPTDARAPNDVAAINLQRWLSSFVVEGQPAATGTMEFGVYGSGGMVQVLNETGVRRVVDGTPNKRCDFWNGKL